MFKLHIKRIIELKAPFDLCVDNINDWTHIPHVHKKSIDKFQLLFKSGQREIFLCKGRILHPFPFFNHYLIFRENVPAQYGFRHLYVNIKNGYSQYMNTMVQPNGETNLIILNYLFHLPAYWRLFPRLFLWIFKFKFDRFTAEDNEWIYERMSIKTFVNDDSCAPQIPETFDLFQDSFKEDPFKNFDVSLEDYTLETFGSQS